MEASCRILDVANVNKEQKASSVQAHEFPDAPRSIATPIIGNFSGRYKTADAEDSRISRGDLFGSAATVFEAAGSYGNLLLLIMRVRPTPH